MSYERFGLVRVFNLQKDEWIQRGSDDDLSSIFNIETPGGCLNSLSGDGIILGVACGEVRIFKWNADKWIQIGDTIFEGEDDLYEVSLSQYGSTIAISHVVWRGAVDVYKFIENSRIQQGRRIREDQLGDGFNSIQLNSNGNVICTGSTSLQSFESNLRIFNFVELEWVRIGPSSSGKHCSISSDGDAFAGTLGNRIYIL